MAFLLERGVVFNIMGLFFYFWWFLLCFCLGKGILIIFWIITLFMRRFLIFFLNYFILNNSTFLHIVTKGKLWRFWKIKVFLFNFKMIFCFIFLIDVDINFICSIDVVIRSNFFEFWIIFNKSRLSQSESGCSIRIFLVYNFVWFGWL